MSLFNFFDKVKKPKNMVPQQEDPLTETDQVKAKQKNTIQFIGQSVEVIRRPYQRSISILVKPSGQIRMTCARSTPRSSLILFLNKHKNWLWNILEEQKSLRIEHPPKKFVIGEEFLYLGDTVYLNFAPTTNKKISYSVVDDQLIASIPEPLWGSDYSGVGHPELRDSLVRFYKQRGIKTLEYKIKILSEKMGLYPKKVSFRSQRTRWGSCSSQGHISLNWRLIAAPTETLEYVVIHELAHLEYHNHSKAFWSLVKKYSFNFNEHKSWLRNHQFHMDFLADKSELYPERNSPE